MTEIRKKLRKQVLEEQFKNTPRYRRNGPFSKLAEIIKRLREEFLEEQSKLTPRYRRAKRISNIIMHILFDFMPSDRACLSHIEQHLTQTAFNCNLEIVEVAYDELGQADQPACASECCTDPT